MVRCAFKHHRSSAVQHSADDWQMDYYLKTHMPLVDKHWGPFGMKSWTIVQFQENDPSGMHVQAIMLWESVEAFEKAIAANVRRKRYRCALRWPQPTRSFTLGREHRCVWDVR